MAHGSCLQLRVQQWGVGYQPLSSPHTAAVTLIIRSPQHASADVEKMILGNKCDVNDKRQVSKERGEKVGARASPTPGDPRAPSSLLSRG